MTTAKDRDKIARRLADQKQLLAGAQRDLVAAEHAWQAAVVDDDSSKLDAAERRRARAAAKVTELADVEHRVRILLDQADADIARQRAEAEHKAAAAAHRQAAQRVQRLAGDLSAAVEQALSDGAVIVDRLRGVAAEYLAAVNGEDEARRQVADAAVVLGVQPDLPPALDRLDAAMNAMADLPARQLWSAATHPGHRRRTLAALGESAAQRALADEPRMSYSL